MIELSDRVLTCSEVPVILRMVTTLVGNFHGVFSIVAVPMGTTHC